MVDGSDVAKTGLAIWVLEKTAGPALKNIGGAGALLTLPIVSEVGKLVERYLERNGRTLDDLNPRYREFFPILEASAYETDPTLREMWKNLMANSIISNSQMVYNYTEICKQLTPPLAQILLLQEEFDQLTPVENRSASDQNAVQVEDDFRSGKCPWLSKEDLVIALEYLTTLGIVATDWVSLTEIYDAGLLDEAGQRRADELPATFYGHRISSIGKSFLARTKEENIGKV